MTYQQNNINKTLLMFKEKAEERRKEQEIDKVINVSKNYVKNLYSRLDEDIDYEIRQGSILLLISVSDYIPNINNYTYRYHDDFKIIIDDYKKQQKDNISNYLTTNGYIFTTDDMTFTVNLTEYDEK